MPAKRLLLVDDAISVRDLVRCHLNALFLDQLAIYEAGLTGACHIIKDINPNAVVMAVDDLNHTPVGIEILTRLRSDGYRVQPVFLYSLNPHQLYTPDQLKCLGATDFFLKHDTDGLARAISTHLKISAYRP